jgi:hypothetical protein
VYSTKCKNTATHATLQLISQNWANNPTIGPNSYPVSLPSTRNLSCQKKFFTPFTKFEYQPSKSWSRRWRAGDGFCVAGCGRRPLHQHQRLRCGGLATVCDGPHGHALDLRICHGGGHADSSSPRPFCISPRRRRRGRGDDPRARGRVAQCRPGSRRGAGAAAARTPPQPRPRPPGRRLPLPRGDCSKPLT